MFHKLFASPHRRSVLRPFRKLMLEALEDRLAPAVYSLTDLGKLSAGYNVTAGSNEVINSAGQVVGTSSASSASSQAVLYSNGQLTNLGTLAGFNGSQAAGINNSGQVVGSLIKTTNGTRSLAGAFLYSDGHMTDLSSLVTGGSPGVLIPVAINDSGQIAGDGTPPTSGTGADQAFLYNKGTVTYLGSFSSITGFSEAIGINASGQVVGFSDSSSFDNGNNTEHAFLYSNGKLIDLGTLAGNSDKYNSIAYAINNSGQVVGYSGTSSGVQDAFLYSNGQMTDLGTPAGYSSSFATGINNSGQIVGFSGSTNALHAFLYSNSKWTDLNSLMPAGTTVTLTNAVGINDNGQIVATGSDGHLYLLTPQQATGTVITGNPSNQTVTVGQTATFTASATGNPTPAVQWQVSRDGGKTFSNITGATGTTLMLHNVTASMNGYEYRAVFSNSAGSVPTSAAKLTVRAAPPPTPSPTPPPPPSITDQVQQLVQDVVLMEQSLLSGDITTFGQALQNYESLLVNVELEIVEWEIFQMGFNDLPQIQVPG